MSPSIEEVKKKHTQRLLAMPGVISVGIGKNPEGQSVIIIGLESLHPEKEKKIPKTLEGYPVQIEIIDKIKTL
jgi:hypothetical protein